MFRKIFDWYMEQKVSHILLTIYLTAATSATFMIPNDGGPVLWAWGAGATLIVGPWMWSLNRITEQNSGKNLWHHG
jgi:hypothetical protein